VNLAPTLQLKISFKFEAKANRFTTRFSLINSDFPVVFEKINSSKKLLSPFLLASVGLIGKTKVFV